jgi:hypothetical protein
VAAKLDEPADRRHVHHQPVALRAHHRQHRLGHVDEPEHVGLEHVAHFLVVALLDGGEVAVARVVHQRVDAPEMLARLRHHVLDLLAAGHVQRQHQRAIAVAFGNVGHLRRVARGDHGAPSAREHQLGEFAAEAGGASRDQPDGVGSIHHAQVLHARVFETRRSKRRRGYAR